MRLPELGRWLNMYRISSGIGDEQLAAFNEQLEDWRARLNIDSLASLEEGDPEGHNWHRGDLSLEEVTAALNAYGMSELMVDHLRVEKHSKHIVRHVIDDFAPHSADKLGNNAQYFFPKEILENRDRAKLLGSRKEPYPDGFPVRVLLPQPGDFSQSHEHPGEEILLCLKGRIKIQFDHLNTFVELGQNDYAHFYADQKHTAINVGNGEAEMFVLRAYLLASSPRRKLYESAEQFEGALLKPERVEDVNVSRLRRLYRAGAGAWLKQTLGTLNARTKELPSIADPIGLARQLRAMGYKTKDLLDRAIKLKEDKKLKEIYGKRKYDQFCSGFLERDANIDDLNHLAKLCALPPPLLYCFLFARVPAVSAIRYGNDLRTAPGNPPPLPNKIEYRYPKHNLADSGLTITYLEMPKRSASEWNNHSGSELCLPISGGNIRIELNAHGEVPTETIGSNPAGYLHYCSHFPHRLYNDGDQPASVFVVRFFDTLLPPPLALR